MENPFSIAILGGDQRHQMVQQQENTIEQVDLPIMKTMVEATAIVDTKLNTNAEKITLKIDEYVNEIYEKMVTPSIIGQPAERLLTNIVFKKFLTDFITARLSSSNVFTIADVVAACIAAFKHCGFL